MVLILGHPVGLVFNLLCPIANLLETSTDKL